MPPNGLKGHPKVKTNQNPAWQKVIKGSNVYEECKKICDKRNNCAVFAVNKIDKLCATFTNKNLNQKEVLWKEHNKNMKWVS